MTARKSSLRDAAGARRRRRDCSYSRQLHETTPRAHRELGTARRGGARTTRKLTEAQQSARSCLTAAALPNSSVCF
ncbi:hypothetical protein BU14_0384s0009 [Porphyra umbilicalis]|uniref:Uncharacterized protein n=1 Tax=Porphyra umbilicalis TaxID=2786 RepID=A0A1X6NWS3_PORUM|nr:hypothetical protein BU14_0384s0009 [Porphyra umbilicalis]|eukprot:OSX73022.1 hypothetical protein BU14_0384s0009 [Porphyra umbilicalis]